MLWIVIRLWSEHPEADLSEMETDAFGPFVSSEEADGWQRAVEEVGLKGHQWHITTVENPILPLVAGVLAEPTLKDVP